MKIDLSLMRHVHELAKDPEPLKASADALRNTMRRLIMAGKWEDAEIRLPWLESIEERIQELEEK